MKATDIEKVEAVSRIVMRFGYAPDGFTEERVEPVNGKFFHPGRRRFRKGLSFITVGPRTVCFYRKWVDYFGGIHDWENLRTTDIEGITRELEKRKGKDEATDKP